MNKCPVTMSGPLSAATVWLAGVMITLGVTGMATAADRVVLCEEFTNYFCGSCGTAGPALSMLVDTYPDTFAFVQIQMFDATYSTPWGDARWTYYDAHATPASIFNGIDMLEGALEDIDQQYTLYRANHFLPERGISTDVTIDLSGEPLTGQTYHMSAVVGIEPDGEGKTLQIQMVQVLDHWPATKPYHRNGFKQAAPPQEITLAPGESQTIEHDFTFDAESWADQDNIKIIAWAQIPADTGPAYVYQSAIRLWPLISYPGDYDGDGYLDGVDNCPSRYNPGQEDEDEDGAGDICDNCLGLSNPDQLDGDEDRAGNDCDNCPQLHSLYQDDTDGDEVGNPCDSCPDVPSPAGVDPFGRTLGALDLDCDVDVDDMAILIRCLGGPDVTVPPAGCDPAEFAKADLDGDGDVDLADHDRFNQNFTGPLASPALFIGASSCIECHEDHHGDWIQTIHATAFDTLIEDGAGDNVLCYPCHTVGYGLPSGFVDLETTPQLADVQCENCHGAGSNHAADPFTERMEINFDADHCGECHQSCHGLCGENHHPQHEQWLISGHAQALNDLQADPTATDECLQCHSTDYRLTTGEEQPSLWTAEFAIECVACHRAHGSPHKGQLRLEARYLCAECHTMGTVTPPDSPPQPQVETLHGTGALAEDWSTLEGPYSEHWWGLSTECVACHVHFSPYGGPEQPVDSGHTFLASMRACLPCHTQEAATRLVEMMREEIELRLATIAHYFDPEDPLYVDPFQLPPEDFMPYYAAKFNYEMVMADRSYGSHNPPYVRALLDQVESFFGIPPWRGRSVEGGHAQPADDRARLHATYSEVR